MGRKMDIGSKLEKLRDVADRVSGGRVREGYSGRCMYGRKCLALVCDYVSEGRAEAARAGFRGGRVDSMGLGCVIYWPGIDTTEWLKARDEAEERGIREAESRVEEP